ncbi:hypothetical protein EUTSA_v10028855mg [Eutrema salsugineum]|uniref:DUF4408 domain-containing protein n=1 Tax=Eutrema salsugineum TaxID=72664 RepID=V4KJS0_EUTSA|nr:uncharacterized protein LOC18014301 [Eutrema salsugineum]ESQ38095.1 hypothetical protein EUTSA_v10028855mg [Eutrema salsugineum]
MLTSRAWIIASGLVGAISLMLRSALNFSVTGSHFSLPSLNPLFIIINGIIFALAASASLFGHGSDSPATEHHHDDDDVDHYHYEHDHHYQRDHNLDHDRSSKNLDDHDRSSYDRYSKKVHEEEKFPVRSESGGSYGVHRPVTSPEVHFPSTMPPKKAAGLRRPPTAPKTFPQDDKSGDENETMEEMWKRVKAEKQPKKTNTWKLGQVIRRNDSRMSTSSCPSPSSTTAPGMKLMKRIPSWVKLKKELSMGRDELNSRVEDFINKFKDEMKLQRLESLRRYKLFRDRSDEKL